MDAPLPLTGAAADGAPMPRRVDVAVVGAGIGGLVAAHLARRAGCSVVVLDGQRPGGRGSTDDRGGFRLNRGPHALYLAGPAARILGELGVPTPGRPPHPDAWASLTDRIAPLPATAGALVRSPLLGWRGRLALARLLRRLPRIDAGALAGTSWRAWLDDQELPADARRLVELLGRVATYAHAPDLAGADLVVGQVRQAMTAGVRYLDGGWQRLVDHLAAGVPVARAAATRVAGDGDGVVVVTADDEPPVAGRAVVVAAGTPSAATHLLGPLPCPVGPPIEASCLDVGTRQSASPAVLLGLDEPLYLSDHGRAAAGLAPDGATVVHVARYLAPGEHRDPAATRAELEAHARRAGIDPATSDTARYLHRMVVVGALATAELGGLAGRPGVRDSGVPGVFLAGDWVGPTGHLLDAVLASAEQAASAAVHHARTAATSTTVSRRLAAR